MKKPKVIFITGATGFLGSNLVVRFLKRNYQLKLLVRGKPDFAAKRVDSIISNLFQHNEYANLRKNIEIITGDITKENLGISPSGIRRMQGEVDDVFHCAASVSFDEEKADEIKRQNVEGTRNVLELVKKLKNPSLHYMGTAYVAGNRKGVVYEDELDKGQTFYNAYEESKFKAESLIRQFHEKYGIRTTIYRPAVVVGDSKTGRTSNFTGIYSLIRSLYVLSEMLKRDLKGKGNRAKSIGMFYFHGDILYIPLRVPGIAEKTINLVPVNYLVDVIDMVYKKCNSPIKAYHITNPIPPTIGHIQHLSCLTLGISGIKMADPKEFLCNPMNPWEKFFAESIKTYRPYLEEVEPIFSSKNTSEILNSSSISCPYITPPLMSKLVSFCITSNWGQKP